jgi:hypothetical protein
MKKVFMIIGVAIAMFGVAAIGMARHSHHPHKAYANCQGTGC